MEERSAHDQLYAVLPRLTLVGYRACGKSTAGRLVASRIGWPFVDADHVIEAMMGMPISAFFAAHGEPAFRDVEEKALASILAVDHGIVLATGGGAVLRAGNRTLLGARGGLVVYLQASAEILQARLRHHAGERPSLTGVPVADEVPALLAIRDPLYRATAQHVVDATRGTALVTSELHRLICANRTTDTPHV